MKNLEDDDDTQPTKKKKNIQLICELWALA